MSASSATPEFAKALLDEAATLFLSDEPETARLILRDLVNATLGFEQLAALTAKPSKSLHRMLSPKGNPSMTHHRQIRYRRQHRQHLGNGADKCKMQNAKGKLPLPQGAITEQLEAQGFVLLPVLPRHIEAARSLSCAHADPFDRLLIAQATMKGWRC